MTGREPTSSRDDYLGRVRDALDAGGVEAIIALLNENDNPKRAAAVFGELLQNLYQTRKDVTGMIRVANAGVDFCLAQARQAADPADALDFRQTAKAIAYNAGANCWPGWGDEGVEIAPEHIEAGMELAEANRDLTRELQLGPEPMANATWLNGALRLAAGEPVAALAEFREARRLADAAGKTDLALMAAGYGALALKAAPATASEGAEQLDLALARLRESGSQEARFFADQIVTASKILS
ncbi:hypothetical protein [Methylocystis heyeri]|uniref:Tetratricopeptide repeat protein n=1 Tax=Methylocystis heyeri TaxID=391905 RepID=A0A6B8KD52_9HYPH|nr:hypothetical protein [Methylocystis heyeri]QGM44941.1 hypothetical protein H2LOC_004150 [Methylocystis heyeri]